MDDLHIAAEPTARAQVRRAAVLVNGGAGGLGDEDRAALRARLAAAFADRGIAAELDFPSGGELTARAEAALAAAQRDAIDAVVVGGGDGSIRAVAGVLAGTGVALGILPLGTFNHFAKDLGIPGDIEGAAAVIAAGQARSVDLGEVNGRVFINNSSIGLYPAMVLERDRQRRAAGLPKWLAGALASLRMLRRFPLHRLAIVADSGTEPVRTPCLFVGNNDYDLTLFAPSKRARLDAGELVLHVARQESRIALLWLAVRAFLGRLDQERDLRTLRADSARITARQRRLFVAMDGEVEHMQAPLLYRSRPGALRVLAPPGPERRP